MAGGKSYYAVLGLTRDASAGEIFAAWRRLSTLWNPDNGEWADWQKELALPRYMEIQEAYEVLSNPVRKALYDASMFVQRQFTLFTAARGGDKKDESGGLPRPRPRPRPRAPAAGRVRPPARRHSSSPSSSPELAPAVGRIDLFVSFTYPAAPDPGTSGGGAGPKNARGKQRPRIRRMSSILEAKLKFPDDRED